MLISHDSCRLVAILKVDDEHSIIRQYDIDQRKKTEYESMRYNSKPYHIHLKGEYIKINDVAQNSHGMVFSSLYFDNGEFWVIVFNRSKVLSRFNVNKAINLDKNCRAIDNFNSPMGGVTFISKNNIFINVYHTRTNLMYTMTYSFLHKKLISEVKVTELKKKTLNSPMKPIWEESRNIVFMLFRQGTAYVEQLNDKAAKVSRHTVSDTDVNNPYLYKNKVLVIMSAQDILFYMIDVV